MGMMFYLNLKFRTTCFMIPLLLETRNQKCLYEDLNVMQGGGSSESVIQRIFQCIVTELNLIIIHVSDFMVKNWCGWRCQGTTDRWSCMAGK